MEDEAAAEESPRNFWQNWPNELNTGARGKEAHLPETGV